MKDYSVVRSDEVFKGKILDVIWDVVRMPGGGEALREVVRHGAAAAVLPVVDGKIILVRQYRHPIKGFALEIPAGMTETGEDPKDCAARELEEETGYKCADLTFLFKMYSSIGFCTELLHVYLAENLTTGVQNLDPDEFVTVEAYDVERATDMIFSGEIVDSKTIAAILAYRFKR
ncbi:MAG: NUDIX hydrolase [Clostridiales bacterium]|jgi:ADP-ribose pyrophosphatase|nr:NUDIX hydrolase [Clostridiales bacterium]